MTQVKKIYYLEDTSSNIKEQDDKDLLKKEEVNKYSLLTDKNLNGNSNYFWKTGYNVSDSKNDGMDSLSSLANFNRIVFLK